MATVILEHIYDEANALYSVTFGDAREIVHESEIQVSDPDNPEAGSHTEISRFVETVYENVETIVFSAEDDRWKIPGGGQRPIEEVAAEQRQIIKDVLDQRALEAEHARESDPGLTMMPGVGEAL